jgi:hypothetical protein
MNFTLGVWDDWESHYRSYWDDIDDQAKKLDYVYPNWFNEIDLDRMDMIDSENCILMQLFGEVWMTAEYLGLDSLYFAGGDIWWYTQILNRRNNHEVSESREDVADQSDRSHL